MRLANAAALVASLMLAGLLAGCGQAPDGLGGEGGGGSTGEEVEYADIMGLS